MLIIIDKLRCLVHTDNGHAHTNFYFSGFVLTKSSLKLEQHFLTFRTDNIRGLGPTWRHLHTATAVPMTTISERGGGEERPCSHRCRLVEFINPIS